jgi:hypothetical protein
VTLADPETRERRVVDLSDPEVRRRLGTSPASGVDEAFRRARVDVLTLATTESYERPLAAFFEARERRR